MAEFKPRAFGYAHSPSILKALTIEAQNRRSYIAGGYDFLENRGEHTAFDKMIELAKEGGRDTLYVDTVKEFAGDSLADFKAALTAIENAGMLIISAAEPQYNYYHFMTAIEVLEDLEPGYVKNRQSIVAVTMSKLGAEMADICGETGLNESDVFQAIAEYTREQEQKQE